MTIGIDIRSLAGGAYTGVGEYTRNLLENLIAVDSSIEFKLFFNAQSHSPDMDFFKNVDNIKQYFFRYPNKYFSATTRLLGTPKIDKIIGGCDVFFSPHFIASPTTKGCKKVVTFHDLSFERYPEFFDKQRMLWHFSNRPQKQAQEADKIIAVSESTAYDLSDIYKIDPRKISVVYSGSNEGFGEHIAPKELWRVQAKYQLPKNFILSLSTIEPRKNVQGTIKAFEIFKEYYGENNVSLIIAGKPGWLCRDIFSAIEKSPYKSKIKYMGFIDDQDKPALYKLAKIFVYPSIYEGFGLPPLEAMAMGTPIVTSACSSLPEVVEDAAIMVDPFRISDIAWAMNEILSDEELARFLSEKGIAQARKFSWQKCAKETLEVLTSPG